VTLDLDRVQAALPAYDIGGELGRGGWGIVLAGRHRQLGRDVAIKQLPRAFAHDPAVRARFVGEARLLASLDHPHIVPVYDFVEAEGLCVLVMEKLPGGTLWQRFTTAGVTMETACAAVLAACAGLHAAHQRGILHRDVKPENLLFSTNDVLKVTDFGISKMVGGDSTVATRAGEVLGTPAYMSPEQCQGGDLGPATDVYAAGVMLYELLSGRLPFPDDDEVLTVLYRRVYERPRPLLDVAATVPPAIAGVVMRALEPDPAHRYPTAEAFAIALAEAATASWGPGWPSARAHVAVMGAGPILAATERPTGAGTGGTGDTGNGGTGTASPAPATVAREAPAPAPPPGSPAPPAAPAPAAPPTPVASARVRPTVMAHARWLPPPDVDVLQLVPVRLVLPRPPAPKRAVAWAAGLALVMVAVALLGILPPPRGGTVGPGEVLVAGRDPATEEVTVDLDEPVAVSVAGSAADTVEVRLSAAGIRLGSATAALAPAGEGQAAAELDLAAARYLAPPTVTGELVLRGGGAAVASERFPVRPARTGLLTVPGVVGVAGLLFVIAYAESLLRSLRRGRKRVVGVVGMAGVGALLGLDAVVLAWAGAGREPVVLTAAACAVLGAAAGVVGARAAAATARRPLVLAR
jgi:serine/threonine-protein kinase